MATKRSVGVLKEADLKVLSSHLDWCSTKIRESKLSNFSDRPHRQADKAGKSVGYAYDEEIVIKHIPPVPPKDYSPERERPDRLTAIHDAMYTQNIIERCFEIDTSVATFEDDSPYAARVAAGSVCEAARYVAYNRRGIKSAFAVVRPPGHHAEPQTGMGFCIFNNIAHAASVLLSEGIMNKILIVDWDVHHGNGTQSIFWEDDRVMYFSIHRVEPEEDKTPFYPGGSKRKDINWDYNSMGENRGLGYTVNVPLTRNSGNDVDYVEIWKQILIPVATTFNPDIVLISAGFDAVEGDIGGFHLTPSVYPYLLSQLMPLADGKILLALEGGYDCTKLSLAVVGCIKCLLGDPLEFVPKGQVHKETELIIKKVLAARASIRPTIEVSHETGAQCPEPPRIRRRSARVQVSPGTGAQCPEPPHTWRRSTRIQGNVRQQSPDLMSFVKKKISNQVSSSSSSRVRSSTRLRRSSPVQVFPNWGITRARSFTRSRPSLVQAQLATGRQSPLSRAWLVFPVRRISTTLYTSLRLKLRRLYVSEEAFCVSEEAVIYFTRVLEVVVRAIISIAVEYCQMLECRRITPAVLRLTQTDFRLAGLLTGIIPRGGGIGL